MSTELANVDLQSEKSPLLREVKVIAVPPSPHHKRGRCGGLIGYTRSLAKPSFFAFNMVEDLLLPTFKENVGNASGDELQITSVSEVKNLQSIQQQICKWEGGGGYLLSCSCVSS